MGQWDYQDALMGSGPTIPEHIRNESALSGVASTMFVKAVVVEVLYDPALLTTDIIESYEKTIDNPAQFRAAPRGSLLVKLVSDGAARVLNSIQCVYPMFSPHIQLPVKSGETVWVFDPTPEVMSDEAYWVCRVHTSDFVDDINYTHHDRSIMETFNKMDPAPEKPLFPNGTMTPEGLTLSKANEYDVIFSGSAATMSTTFEPVPRFTSRPGDMALQGSNNTLVCLGQDRGFTKAIRPTPDPASPDEKSDGGMPPKARNSSSANYSHVGSRFGDPTKVTAGTESTPPTVTQPGASLGRGTIDIVAGRGQSDGTKPVDVENDRSFLENSKNPINFSSGKTGVGKSNKDSLPNEGDPDFVDDLSRVYVSMKTSGDTNFGLEYPSFTGAAVDEKPYIIAKSDEVRVIGRKDGSVRIIKEGAVAGDQAIITLLADGTVSIDAKKILIGDGRDGQTYIGDPQKGGSQPLVLANALKDMLSTFCTNAGSSVDSHGKPVEPLNSACADLKTALPEFVSKVGFISDKAEK